MRTETTAGPTGQTTGAIGGQRGGRKVKASAGNGAAPSGDIQGQDHAEISGSRIAGGGKLGKGAVLAQTAQPPFLVPSYPAGWTYAQKLEAEIFRAANIGKRLKLAGVPVMQGCPEDATPEETALYLQQAQNAVLETSAAALLVA